MMRNVIIFSGLVLLISCTKLQCPEFKTISGFTVTGSGDKVILKGTGVFYNPNKTKLMLKNADVSVYLNEQLITRIEEKFNMEIPPEQEFMIPMIIELDQDRVKALVTENALSLLTGRELSLKYKGRIRIKSSGFPLIVPIDEEISINLNDLL